MADRASLRRPIPTEKRRLRLPARPLGPSISAAHESTAAQRPSRHGAFSPRPSSYGPRTTSDIVAAPRQMNGAHWIERVLTENATNSLIVDEWPRASTSSISMPTHREGASVCHAYSASHRFDSARDLLKAGRDSRAFESCDAHDVEHDARPGSGSSPEAQQRRRTSFENVAKRPRGEGSMARGPSRGRALLCR